MKKALICRYGRWGPSSPKFRTLMIAPPSDSHYFPSRLSGRAVVRDAHKACARGTAEFGRGKRGGRPRSAYGRCTGQTLGRHLIQFMSPAGGRFRLVGRDGTRQGVSGE